ncbi:MAG: hypothetical protein ACKN9T_02650 [Candidatus Methylumidiphilus sp.]
MKTSKRLTLLGMLALLAATTCTLWPSAGQPTGGAALSVGHGDVATLKAAFDSWRQVYEKQGGSPETLKLSLGYSKALSAEFTKARGQLTFNLLDGRLSVETAGLADGQYALWLVDDGTEPGNTVKPEASDKLLRVGSLESRHGRGHLGAQMTPAQLADFNMDTAVLTLAGQSPVDNVVIAGSPDLLEKLYYAQQSWTLAGLGETPAAAPAAAKPFEFLLPKPAMADTLSDLTPVLGAQVALGRQIFHNETFGGNGRTCGTCHRADNNFTIDPNYIGKLPATDPLFVAETQPALANLENPTLLRKYGLILTNVDGPGTDVFRAVPHTLSLATSAVSENTAATAPYAPGDFAADNAFAAATGWSGDGAPGSGSLREFALGAVIQHLPKTLSRVAGTDFRLPTQAELDAIEAYTLSLGRSKDYPVYQLTFADPLTQAGKVLFDTKQNPCTHNTAQTGGPSPAAHCPSGETIVQGETANCNGCHQHAGARSSTTFSNPTRNTGVENFKIHPARLVKPDLAYDGGFGVAASVCGPSGQTCYGDGRFNTMPLIEAADTPPYFHNNSVSTLEEAIASYNSDAFNQSPGALTAKLADRKVKLDATQVVAVASFLRAINAVENIRLSNRLDGQARQVANNASARELAKLAQEENQDAIQVLKEGVLGAFGNAVKKLEQASYYQTLAQLAPAQTLRNALLQQAITAKKQAKALIASCDPNAARPSTVVASPAGFVYTCAEVDAF